MALSIPSPSDKAVTVSSIECGGKELHSALKRPNQHQQPSAQTPRRRVRFGHDQVKLIAPLSGHDLWTHKGSNAERCYTDKNTIRTNRSAGQYVKAHWAAYDQFTACCNDGIKPYVSNDIKKRLVFGVNQGHRSLERHSTHYAQVRKEQATRNVHSILFAYHRQGKRDDRLRLHSKRCSQTSRNWALFLASIDAAAAREESPPAVKPFVSSNTMIGKTKPAPPSKDPSPSSSSLIAKATILPDFHRLKIHDDDNDADKSNALCTIQRMLRKSKPSPARKAQAALLWKRQDNQQEKRQAKAAELRVMAALSLSCGGW